MTPIEFMLAAFGGSIAAGLLGSLLGLGGGIIVVPLLTLLLGVDIRYAIGASLVSVIATSSASSAAYVRDRLSNLRVGMLLELGTIIGAVGGAFAAGFLDPRWLYVVFAVLMLLVAVAMWRDHDARNALRVGPGDPLADALRLHGSLPPSLGGVAYVVRRVRLAIGLSVGAGGVSGLLGVGGGVMMVPTMTLGMGMPLKAATATSNFMMGATAAASAGVYFARGDIEPAIAGPVGLGVLVGASVGARLLARMPKRALRVTFSLLLAITAIQMAKKGLA